jgi:hypothetical protein
MRLSVTITIILIARWSNRSLKDIVSIRRHRRDYLNRNRSLFVLDRSWPQIRDREMVVTPTLCASPMRNLLFKKRQTYSFLLLDAITRHFHIFFTQAQRITLDKKPSTLTATYIDMTTDFLQMTDVTPNLFEQIVSQLNFYTSRCIVSTDSQVAARLRELLSP